MLAMKRSCLCNSIVGKLNDRNQLQGGTAYVPDQTVESFVLCCSRMRVLAYIPCSLESHSHCARGLQVHMKFDLVDT